MAKILIIRFSAIGDVAMTIPIIHSLAVQHPQHQLTVLSRKPLAPLFEQMPANVSFYGADLKGEHAGWKGLNRLYAELAAEGFDAVADLHDVLRSKYLRWRFRLAGAKVAHIDKGREGKKKLVRRENKVMERQKSSFERYREVLHALCPTPSCHSGEFVSLYGEAQADIHDLAPLTGEKGADKWIGIAPFAAHAGKIYPTERMQEVIALLTQRTDVKLFLFGGGPKEKEVLEGWQTAYPRTVSLAGKLNMAKELALMSHLDVMVSMDSANMHLASLVHTPVVSIWGATHPYAGFMGWKQSEENAVQVDLPCRPCSVFGNKPCHRGDYACLGGITPGRIVHQIERNIDK